MTAGDVVRCIDADTDKTLVRGKLYRLDDHQATVGTMPLLSLTGLPGWYLATRFERVEPTPTHELREGDTVVWLGAEPEALSDLSLGSTYVIRRDGRGFLVFANNRLAACHHLLRVTPAVEDVPAPTDADVQLDEVEVLRECVRSLEIALDETREERRQIRNANFMLAEANGKLRDRVHELESAVERQGKRIARLRDAINGARGSLENA